MDIIRLPCTEQENGEREKEVVKAYEAAKTAIIVDYAKKAEEQKAQARQEYGLDTFSDQYAARRKKIENDTLLNEQERQQALTLLDQQAEEHRLQIRQQYGLASQQELYNAELDQLKMHLQNKEISEEEYEEAVKRMKIAKMKEAFDFYYSKQRKRMLMRSMMRRLKLQRKQVKIPQNLKRRKQMRS